MHLCTCRLKRTSRHAHHLKLHFKKVKSFPNSKKYTWCQFYGQYLFSRLHFMQTGTSWTHLDTWRCHINVTHFVYLVYLTTYLVIYVIWARRGIIVIKVNQHTVLQLRHLWKLCLHLFANTFAKFLNNIAIWIILQVRVKKLKLISMPPGFAALIEVLYLSAKNSLKEPIIWHKSGHVV
jgi:hypothetical protein